jgi:hypothetical protein
LQLLYFCVTFITCLDKPIKLPYMKNFSSYCLIIGFILVSLTIKAQVSPTRSVEKIIKQLQSNPDFTGTEVPEKWKNESALILAKSFDYKIKMNAWGSLVENVTFHKRIKLMDAGAISSFYPENILDYAGLDFSITTAVCGMRVIKQNGEEMDMPLQELVTTKDTTLIKAGNYSIIRSSKIPNKIFLPKLEIGDIIDYYIICKSYSNLATKWHITLEEYRENRWLFSNEDFSFVNPIYRTHPVFYKLSDRYPIVKQKFNICPSTWMRLNSRSTNGAPLLMKDKKDGDICYALTDTERGKEESNKKSPYRNFPIVKFQTFYFSNKEMNRYNYIKFFIKPPKVENFYLDFRHIDELVKDIYKTSSFFDKQSISDTRNYLNTNFNKKTPSDTIVKYAYQYMCFSYTEEREDINYRNQFMLNLSKVLESRKIQHDLVITAPNYLSDISDMIFPTEMAFLLRIKGNPDYFIGDHNPSTLKSIHRDYQGNNAFAVSNPKLVSVPVIEKIVIPAD